MSAVGPPHGPRQGTIARMSEVQHGLEGVVAFETQIAEPDKEGSSLRYRGVDIEDLTGRVPFEKVWGLLCIRTPPGRTVRRRGAAKLHCWRCANVTPPQHDRIRT